MSSPLKMNALELKQDNEEHPLSYRERAQADLGLEIKPIYKQIRAVYLALHNPAQEYSSSTDWENPGVFVMSSIEKGVQVNAADMDTMRQARFDSYFARGRGFAFRRQVSNFIGLNICNVIILGLSVILSILIWMNNRDSCSNFAKANLFYAILALFWLIVTLIGINAAHKKIEKYLKTYMVGLSSVLVMTIAVTAYGMLVKDNDPNCNDDSSQSIILVSTAVFTLLDITFFVVLARKLRLTLQTVDLSQFNRSNQPNQQQNNQNAQNRSGASPNRSNRGNRGNGNNRGNRSNRNNRDLENPR